jgi:hypothetical protein
MNNKFYWISYIYIDDESNLCPGNLTLDEHPLRWAEKNKHNYYLMGWIELTAEDLRLARELGI